MIARSLQTIEVVSTDLEESTDSERKRTAESLETYKLMDSNEKRKTFEDVSGKKTTVNEMIQRMKEVKHYSIKKWTILF